MRIYVCIGHNENELDKERVKKKQQNSEQKPI